MMRLVVKGGTGQYSNLIDFKVSGKTGTGQIADPKTGRYYKNKYTASFMAFVPYSHPELAMLVVQQEPSKIGYYGGAVSAPVVRSVFKNALNILNIYPGGNAYIKQSRIRKGGNLPALNSLNVRKSRIGSSEGASINDSGIMQDLKGDTIYQALKILKKYKFAVKISGSGYLYYQSIKPGTNTDNGKVIVLKFRPGKYYVPADLKIAKKNKK